MSAIEVYAQGYCMLDTPRDTTVPRRRRLRLAVVVPGRRRAQRASPARVAPALDLLGLSTAPAESIARRMRRFANAPPLDATRCVQPFARAHLALGTPSQLVLVLDPTSQDDRLVRLTAAVWYRGRARPVAWALWPAKQPLEDERFWPRGATRLATVAALLPAHVPVPWLAERAFGTPAWIDLLTAHGWHDGVRGPGQTRSQDVTGHCPRLDALVPTRGQRAKGAGQGWKKRGWRTARVVVSWGPRHDTPLALVSDLPPPWAMRARSRQRSPIAATLRDDTSHGWHWEHGQVTALAQVEPLLVAMARATWRALYAGVAQATAARARPATGETPSVSLGPALGATALRTAPAVAPANGPARLAGPDVGGADHRAPCQSLCFRQTELPYATQRLLSTLKTVRP